MSQISALSPGNVSKYELLVGVWQENDLLEKAATIKKFQYSTIGRKLEKKQSGIGKDQNKVLKDQKNVIDNNKKDVDNGKENMSDKSDVTKKFDAILKDIKNNEKVTN